MSKRYFYLNNLKLIGKMVNGTGYLYRNKEWQADRDHDIQCRLTGYCPISKTTGNPYMMIKIDEIAQVEAERLMHLF